MSARTRALTLASLAVAVSALTGCVATQRDMLELESQTDSLKKTVASMQANQADLSVQLKQLHEDLTAYLETAKDTQAQMSKLSSKLDDMGASVEQKVASIGTTLTNQQAKGIEDQKAAASAASPTELFNTANVRLGVKDFALAAKGFEDYLAKYPKGALVDVATYKLGEAYQGQRKWESAGRQFAIVLEKYPKSEMTPSARVRYALCLIAMKKNLAEAKEYLESVTTDFPKSPEAKAAAAELKKLSRKE